MTTIFPHKPEWSQLVHVFFADTWQGEPTEIDEMATPCWFTLSDIPFDQMWPDDIFCLPEVLHGKLLRATFTFGENDIILDKTVAVVSVL